MNCVCTIRQGRTLKTYKIIDNTIWIEENENEDIFMVLDIDKKAVVETVGYDIYSVYIDKGVGMESVPYGTEEILTGLIMKYIHSLQGKRAYLTTKEFVQGIGLLGWKTDSKFEIIDNYVTNKPTFIHEGKVITFSQFLTSLASSLTEANPMAK